MERPQTLANLWIVVRILGWLLALEGVVEFFSDVHYHNVFRRLLGLFIDHDPSHPRLPDDWAEWYYS